MQAPGVSELLLLLLMVMGQRCP